jgi:mannosyl-oligosaccharide alpha-1,2-mannosidase
VSLNQTKNIIEKNWMINEERAHSKFRLYIMGLHEEFTKAKEWVEQKFDMRQSGGTLSVFETNIRFVGGLLSAYALTKEQVNGRGTFLTN